MCEDAVLRPRLPLERMKTRADFLRAQKGRRYSAPGLGLETCPSPGRSGPAQTLRVGFTASRKVGGAVERNRAKRRLRAAARAVLPLLGRRGRDYVLIARTATLSRPFAELIGDLTKALAAAHHAIDRETGAETNGNTQPTRRTGRAEEEERNG
jgi:ribonuclease P protein component